MGTPMGTLEKTPVKWLLTILVSVLAAVAGRQLGAGPSAAHPADDGQDLRALRGELQELQRANAELARGIEARAGALAPVALPENELSDTELGAALARWRAAHPAQAEAVAQGKAAAANRVLLGDIDLATVPMDELVATLALIGFGNRERQEVFQKLREAGRIDEYVAAIEKLAEADPKNADLQVALGHAYLQKLFGVGNTPEAGPLAYKSDAAFDRALQIDDQNWGARFSKAVSLSNWPAFMGRGPEAIDQFETLRDQQEALPPRPEYAMTYLFLGNVHQAAGDRDSAIEAWKAGLALFPDEDQLKRALELAESSSDGRR